MMINWTNKTHNTKLWFLGIVLFSNVVQSNFYEKIRSLKFLTPVLGGAMAGLVTKIYYQGVIRNIQKNIKFETASVKDLETKRLKAENQYHLLSKELTKKQDPKLHTELHEEQTKKKEYGEQITQAYAKLEHLNALEAGYKTEYSFLVVLFPVIASTYLLSRKK